MAEKEAGAARQLPHCTLNCTALSLRLFLRRLDAGQGAGTKCLRRDLYVPKRLRWSHSNVESRFDGVDHGVERKDNAHKQNGDIHAGQQASR